jgi:hypothetical protein
MVACPDHDSHLRRLSDLLFASRGFVKSSSLSSHPARVNIVVIARSHSRSVAHRLCMSISASLDYKGRSRYESLEGHYISTPCLIDGPQHFQTKRMSCRVGLATDCGVSTSCFTIYSKEGLDRESQPILTLCQIPSRER